MRNVTLLGATGSIGESTLDVVARHPDRFSVTALAAHRNWQALLRSCRRFRPKYAALLDVPSARSLAAAFAAENVRTQVLAGPSGLAEVAALPEVDTVLAAIVGAAGLVPTLAAAQAGKRILLANKEALVIGGELFMRVARESSATLLPIDSEHNAIFQCLPPGYAGDAAAAGIRRIVLTASGGPFRTTPLDALPRVTPDEASAHPTWRMGRKISIDSATMMNKGLEVIEAHWLFGAPRDAIDVVLHPQSVIHSLVEYVDGAVLAQLGQPDMRTPIAHALAHPERIDSGVPSLQLAAALSFEAVDPRRFPCLVLAYAALEADGSAPIVLNAANEIAVQAFCERRIRFTDIADTCARTLERMPRRNVGSLDEALAIDEDARREACAMLARVGNTAVHVQ